MNECKQSEQITSNTTQTTHQKLLSAKITESIPESIKNNDINDVVIKIILPSLRIGSLRFYRGFPSWDGSDDRVWEVSLLHHYDNQPKVDKDKRSPVRF